MPITQGQITLDESAVIDKRLQTVTRTSGADTVHNEVFCLIDPDAASGDAAIATVPAAVPALTDRGLSVRPINSNRVASGALGALNAAVTIAAEGTGAIHWEIDTGTLVGTVVFEATLDDTNFFAIEAIRIDGTIITSVTAFPARGALTSTGYSQVRLRVSAYTSGTSNARLEASTGTSVVRLGGPLPAGLANIGDVDIASPLVGGRLDVTIGGTNAPDVIDRAGRLIGTGDVAHDAVDSGRPFKIGGVARATEPTAVAAGDRAQALTDLIGKLITLPYATPAQFVNGTATLTGVADVAVIAAGGAGVRNYITSISASNTSATAVRVDFKDGATIFASFFLAASGGGASHVMPVPVRGTANTAVNAALSAAVTDVRVSVQGYRSAA